ncbi:MAG: transposase [Betaproteobacteria bacterium]|nr:transposase [Betaproteobacteria bacterium]
MFEPALETDNEEGVVFHAVARLDTRAIAGVQARVRQRIVRAFARRGLIETDDADKMGGWDHGGGFSVDASVRIDAPGDLVLTPLELIERIAALAPLPRAHRHRYYGVLAPNASYALR